MGELPQGTITFVFTDIERSTETVAEIGDERFADLLEVHRRVLRDAFDARGGVEIGTDGDAMFVAHERASDAVAAAVAAQEALADVAWPDDAPLRVRIGMHSGEALVRDGNYVGHEVHRAKRVSDAGHGGQILLSQTTADLVRDTVELVDLGPHQLKGITEPQRLFQLGTEEFPPLRSPASLRSSLPRERSAFIGRERQIAEVVRLLGDHPLVTVHGVGGAGKTRFAIQVGTTMLDELSDGVCFADLSVIDDESMLVTAVCAAVGLSSPRGLSARSTEALREDHLLTYLADRRALLILDNCEHLLAGCAELADGVLRRCPAMRILATSREPLRIEGEQAWRLPSLELPVAGEVAGSSEAVQLFMARARAVRHDFSVPSADEATAVADICRRLDGIPLAIEFAASLVGHLSPQQIDARLDDRFRLLAGDRRHAPRQQTLEGALDWSHELLEEPERVLLRRLAVFSADFSLEAAEDVCAGGLVEEPAVVDLLGSLVRRSLVVAEPSRGAIRFRLLETVRAYAARHLAAAEETQVLRDRHRDRFLALLEATSWEQVVAARFLSPTAMDRADIAAAIEWSTTEGRLDLVARMAARIAFDLESYGTPQRTGPWLTGPLNAGVDLDPDVAAMCRLGAAPDDGTEVFVDRADAVAVDGSVARPIRVWATGLAAQWHGFFALSAGDAAMAAEARRRMHDAVAMAEEVGPDTLVTARLEAAMQDLMFDDAAAVVRDLDDLQPVVARLGAETRDLLAGAVSSVLAAALYAAGDHDRASGVLQRAPVAAASETGYSVDMAGLAPIFARTDLSRAVSLLAETRRAAQQEPGRADLEAWVGAAGGVLAATGDLHRAAQLLAWARSRTLDIGLPSRDSLVFAVNLHDARLVRSLLPPDELARCKEVGRALSAEQAVESAVEGLGLA